MHEKDLDRMLESSLSSYGDPRADAGLAERILARVSSEQGSNHSAPRGRNRFLLWAAVPAAACLLLTFLLLRSAGPPATHLSARLPQPAASAVSKAPGVANATPAQKTTTSAIHRRLLRPAIAVAISGARPKLDQFPQPWALSPEEQALYVFATQVPEKQRQAILEARKNDNAPLKLDAIEIPQIEMPDTGRN
jgi:hypothetical protein